MLNLLGSRLFYPGPTGGVSFPVFRFRSHQSCCPPSFAPGSSDRLAFSSRHPSQACRPNEQNAPDTRIPLFWCPLFFRGFRQFRGSLPSSFSFLSLLRLISRCPRIWNPRSASLRCHPAACRSRPSRQAGRVFPPGGSAGRIWPRAGAREEGTFPCGGGWGDWCSSRK